MEKICEAINYIGRKVCEGEGGDERSYYPYEFGKFFEFDCCKKSQEERAKLELAGKRYTLNYAGNQVDYCEEHVENFKEIFTFMDFKNKRYPGLEHCVFCSIRDPKKYKPSDFWFSSWDNRHKRPGVKLGTNCQWYMYEKRFGGVLCCCLDCWNSLSCKQMLTRVEFEPNVDYLLEYIEDIETTNICRKPTELTTKDLYNPTILDTWPDDEDITLDVENITFDNCLLSGYIEDMYGFDTMTESLHTWVQICEGTTSFTCNGGSILYMNIADPKLPVACMGGEEEGFGVVKVFEDHHAFYKEWKRFAELRKSKKEVEENQNYFYSNDDKFDKFINGSMEEQDVLKITRNFAIFVLMTHDIGTKFN